MKPILTLLSAILLLGACSKTPKDYATLSGKITNVNEFKKITISNRKGYKKEIKVDDNGTFSDTLHITEGMYRFSDGNEIGTIYLKKDNTISFTLDAKAFDETLKFEGDDADQSNFMIDNSLLQERYLSEDLFDSTEAEFSKTFDNLETAYDSLKSEYKQLDTAYFEDQDKEFKSMQKTYKSYFLEKLKVRKLLAKGTASPVFSKYENHKGGTTSLSDFKGKYVYIDIWATWCGPCKVEFPFLKKLEVKYHDKNIEFVSISVDDARRSGTMEKAHDAWKKMVTEKKLTGVQLFTGNGWKADFVQDYKVNGIPRFILIAPDGTIVNADAPRPSSKGLIKLFEELGI
ncbi:MAG: TlpA disulfide reductase family protein [Flavobacteriaceae bacterium]|nr:TlpA disulfide reductase family protein [Flavobacteriaceae bacterium]